MTSVIKTAHERLDVVVLCAGNSSRLGSPKQLASLGGLPLLERQLTLALRFLDNIPHPGQVVIVSGAFLQQDCQLLSQLENSHKLVHLFNAQWQHGMVSSLNCARSIGTRTSALVLLVDQYRLSLNKLLALHAQWRKSAERPAASGYDGTIGPPVIWPADFWSPRNLNREALTKSTLLDTHPTVFTWPEAAHDLDTDDDLQQALTYFTSSPRRP